MLCFYRGRLWQKVRRLDVRQDPIIAFHDRIPPIKHTHKGICLLILHLRAAAINNELRDLNIKLNKARINFILSLSLFLSKIKCFGLKQTNVPD